MLCSSRDKKTRSPIISGYLLCSFTMFFNVPNLSFKVFGFDDIKGAIIYTLLQLSLRFRWKSKTNIMLIVSQLFYFMSMVWRRRLTVYRSLSDLNTKDDQFDNIDAATYVSP